MTESWAIFEEDVIGNEGQLLKLCTFTEVEDDIEKLKERYPFIKGFYAKKVYILNEDEYYTVVK